MDRFTIGIKFFAVATALAISIGCSKPESEETPAPVEPPAVKKVEAPKAPMTSTPAPATPELSPPQAPAPQALPVPQPSVGGAEEALRLETRYLATPDYGRRVEIIYQLSSTETSESLDTIGRLFLRETDQELKIELVNSLFDFDGEKDRKLTILSAAIAPHQPKEVREEGIDGLVDVEDVRAIQILQGLLSDRDPDIREAAQDAIEQLQAMLALQQP